MPYPLPAKGGVAAIGPGQGCYDTRQMSTASLPGKTQDTRQTFLYFGLLTLFVYLALPTGYLVDIQTSYMLKNQLHATATQISTFRLLTGIPVYFAFAFGLMRDMWNPLGSRD